MSFVPQVSLQLQGNFIRLRNSAKNGSEPKQNNRRKPPDSTCTDLSATKSVVGGVRVGFGFPYQRGTT